ncbi:Transposon Ty3-G Gag-Pol polyprotein, partial [Choanephora cucurbitarum]
NFPWPQNESAVREFVNLCGFYRRHIPGFADIAAPMNNLLKKRNPFIWDDDCESFFNGLKEALINAVTLVIPDQNTQYRLYCDASEVGIGACLATIDENNEERPVLFLSRKLQPAETRYPTVEKELLAVIYAFKKLRKYLLDRKFVLFCDNFAVCYLFNKNEPSQRLQRWIMCTQEFSFVVKHLPSSKNSVADALSRFPPRKHEGSEDGEDHIDALFNHLMIEEQDRPIQFEQWLQDLTYYFLFPGNATTTSATKRLSLKYHFENNNLYRRVGQRLALVPPTNDRQAILHEVHEGHGHFGIHASWARLYKDYWWPNSYLDLRKHIKTCRECQLFSHPITNEPIQRVPIHYLFEQFVLDFVGPLPKTNNGNSYILVAVEAFSRWPIAIATANTEAKTVSSFLYKHIFCMFGLPTHILTDNGASFDNEIVDNFLSLVNTHHKFTAPYRPSTNGQNEQMNGNLVRALKKLCICRVWHI